MSRRLATPAAVALAAALLSGCLEEGNESTVTIVETTPTGTALPSGPGSPSAEEPTATTSASGAGDGAGPTSSGPPEVVETVAEGLEVPWGVAFLPDGDALVTERDSGRVLRLSGPRHEVSEVADVTQVDPEGEGGLLGIAVSPDFEEDRTVFLYLTTAEDNRVVRGRLEGGGLGDLQPVLTGIPQGFIHDGGRLLFGPDGHLYVSTGEAGEPARAADPDDLGGKVLRITPDGDPAPGNPDPRSPVWTQGHRNVQGLAFVGERLWASEFGDSRFDELNMLQAGKDYGWPAVEGTGGKDQGYVDPDVTWSTDVASPSGLAHLDGRLWLGALRGERLWRVDVDGKRARKPRAFFVGDHGRLRTVVAAPDGTLWVTTSNRDGRGTPTEGDDKILRIRP